MNPIKTKFGSGPANKAPSQRVGRSATALLATGAAAFAVSGSALAAVTIFESGDFANSNSFPGFAATVGNKYVGGVGRSGDVDFFSFSSLNPGDNFNLALNFECCIFILGDDVFAQQFTDTTTFVGSVVTDTTDNNVAEHLTGIVPASGALSFRVSASDNTNGNETYFYDLTLNTSPSARVPEPATVALLAAGLAGALVTRRRRRKQAA
jgi:hypothetical protein